MLDDLVGALHGLESTAVGVAVAVSGVCFIGFILFAIIGAGRVGSQIFVLMPFRIVGLLLVGILKAGGLLAGKVAERGAFELVDLGGRIRRAPDPEVPLVRFEDRRPMDPPVFSGGTRPKAKLRVEHGDWYAFGRTYKDAVHMVMMAAPGAGKDQVGVLPILKAQLEYGDEHLIIVDPKRELRELLSAYLRPDDRCFVYSFSRLTSLSSSISVALDEEDVADVAAFLIPEDGNEGHWARTGQRLFVQVEAALYKELGRRPTLLEIFDHIEDPELFDSLCKRHGRITRVSPNEKEFSGVYSTVLSRLEQFRWPRVRRVFASGAGAERPFEGGSRTVVFLEPDVLAGERLERYVALVLHYLYGLAAEDGRPGGSGSEKGTKVIVDEAASYMRLEKIPYYLDIGRGSRVQLCYVLQNWPQLRDVIGQDKAKRVWGSTELRIVGAGTDRETAEHISELSGRRRVTYLGPRQRNWDKRREQIVRPVVAPEHITDLRKDEHVSELTLTLGPRVELMRVRKPDQMFFARALPPDPSWEYRVPLGIPDDLMDEDPDDNTPPDSPESPQDSPSENPENRDEPYEEPHSTPAKVTPLRSYNRPPKRPPRKPYPGVASLEKAPDSGDMPTVCAICGRTNPPERRSCRGCRAKLGQPTGEDQEDVLG